jgi:hypothetical protein
MSRVFAATAARGILRKIAARLTVKRAQSAVPMA